MQSRRLIFDKKSKFDTAFEGESVENLYLCRQINRNLYAKTFNVIGDIVPSPDCR